MNMKGDICDIKPYIYFAEFDINIVLYEEKKLT